MPQPSKNPNKFYAVKQLSESDEGGMKIQTNTLFYSKFGVGLIVRNQLSQREEHQIVHILTPKQNAVNTLVSKLTLQQTSQQLEKKMLSTAVLTQYHHPIPGSSSRLAHNFPLLPILRSRKQRWEAKKMISFSMDLMDMGTK